MQHSWTWMQYAVRDSSSSSWRSHTTSSRDGCTRTPAASRFGAMVVDGRPFGDSEDGTTRGSTKSRRGSLAHPTPSTTITIPTSSETGTPQCGTTTLNLVESETPAPSPTEFVGKTAAKIRWQTQSISLHTPDRQLTSDSASGADWRELRVPRDPSTTQDWTDSR